MAKNKKELPLCSRCGKKRAAQEYCKDCMDELKAQWSKFEKQMGTDMEIYR